jgi:hypothetical protein
MTLGLTQPLTEMSTSNISWGGGSGKGGRCVGLTTLPPSCADCLEIWEPQPPGTPGAVQVCNVTAVSVETLKSTCLLRSRGDPCVYDRRLLLSTSVIW